MKLSDETMREMSSIALEMATVSIAKKAIDFSDSIPDDINGKEALKAFSEAILSTNSKFFTKGEEN